MLIMAVLRSTKNKYFHSIVANESVHHSFLICFCCPIQSLHSRFDGSAWWEFISHLDTLFHFTLVAPSASVFGMRFFKEKKSSATQKFRLRLTIYNHRHDTRHAYCLATFTFLRFIDVNSIYIHISFCRSNPIWKSTHFYSFRSLQKIDVGLGTLQTFNITQRY